MAAINVDPTVPPRGFVDSSEIRLLHTRSRSLCRLGRRSFGLASTFIIFQMAIAIRPLFMELQGRMKPRYRSMRHDQCIPLLKDLRAEVAVWGWPTLKLSVFLVCSLFNSHFCLGGLAHSREQSLELSEYIATNHF